MVAGPLRSKLPPPSVSFQELTNHARDHIKRQTTTSSEEAMSAAKFFIPSLPGLPSSSSLTMYGGHIPSAPPENGVADTSSDAHLFFFLIRNRHIADIERTVIWFNGGPGCSSFDGSMMEVGPIRMVPGGDGKLKEVDGAWNEYANVLFIDQPAGTGYSYVNTDHYVHELTPMANHVVEFLSNFYNVFPEFTSHDTYLAGESYAGQYIPYIATSILSTTTLPLRLKGLLIGNGWIDPYNQYPAYLEFALKSGIIKKGSENEKRVRMVEDGCMAYLDRLGIEKVQVHNGECEGILGVITDSTVQSVNGQNMCVNNYDVRLTDTHPACGMNWPPDLADITPYLSRPEVKSAFHANRHIGGWVECNGQVGGNFWATASRPAVSLLPKILETTPILFFAGDQDLICNHVGIEKMIDNLEWGGEKGWGNSSKASEEMEWKVDGKNAGAWRTARGLTYVRVADASHMVPYDQPLAAHDMLLRFLGVDLLGAAGPAAQVPSRVGDEQEAVLGSTHLNGTAVQVDDTIDSGSSSKLPSANSDTAIEAIVNVGSAIVIIVLMGLGLAVFWIFRRRMMSKRGHTRGHSRALSSGPVVLPGEEEEGPHELDELVVGGDYRGASSSDGETMGRKEKRRRELTREEEIFGVGDDDDEDEEHGRR